MSISPGDNSLQDAAIRYAAQQGLPVFPLRPRSKEPHKHTHGFKDATTDLGVIAYWWGVLYPGSNIGIRPPRGFVVLDVDPRHGGVVALATLCQQYGDLPHTWTARTGGGGRHLWLRADGPFRGALCTGVDLKHWSSGYVVGPPSIHPDTGRAYAWETSLVSIPHAPDWMHPMLAPPPRPPRTPGSSAVYNMIGLIGVVARATAGNRNKLLHWAACRAVEDGAGTDTFDALEAAALYAGLPLCEIRATINSARSMP